MQLASPTFHHGRTRKHHVAGSGAWISGGARRNELGSGAFQTSGDLSRLPADRHRLPPHPRVPRVNDPAARGRASLYRRAVKPAGRRRRGRSAARRRAFSRGRVHHYTGARSSRLALKVPGPPPRGPRRRQRQAQHPQPHAVRSQCSTQMLGCRAARAVRHQVQVRVAPVPCSCQGSARWARAMAMRRGTSRCARYRQQDEIRRPPQPRIVLLDNWRPRPCSASVRPVVS